MVGALYRPALTHQVRPTSRSTEVTKNDVTVVLPVLNEVEGVTLVIERVVRDEGPLVLQGRLDSADQSSGT